MRAVLCALWVGCVLSGLLAPAAEAGDAIWVWERATESIIEGPDKDAELQKLIDFCRENFIDEIYMAAQKVNPSNRDAQQPSMLIPENYARWEQVLTALHNAGIRVESLSGKGDWLMPTGNWTRTPLNFPLKEDRAYGLDILDDVLTYQAAHNGNPAQQFDGIHLDIEIQTLVPDDPDPNDKMFELYPCPDDPPDGKIDELKRINFFLEFIEQVVAARSAAGYDSATLPFNWDISMNYDLGPSDSAPGHASIPIDYPDFHGVGNVTKPAWQHIFDRLERITFLTYSDWIRPIAAQMKVDLDYVASLPTPPPVRFSLEFQCRFRDIDLKAVSLSDEDRLAYINLRQNADTLMVGRDYYMGWAMHTYDNINANNGDYQTWVAANPPIPYPPRTITFVPDSPVITLPTRPSEPITDPVYVRLHLLADPSYTYTPHSSGNDWVNSMMSILPRGYGYASEDDLNALNDNANPDNIPTRWYDGSAPVGWFYYVEPSMRWWNPGTGGATTSELVTLGLCWINPAVGGDSTLGVVRDIALQRGEDYRLQLIYNGPTGAGIVEFANIPMCGVAPEGNSIDNPIDVVMVLGQLANLGATGEHSNTSVTIVDNDGDGLLDVEEMLMGTDRCDATSPPPPALELVSAVSRGTHDGATHDIDLLLVNGNPVDYDPDLNPDGVLAIEPRQDGPGVLVLEFNADLAANPDVTVHNATLDSANVSGSTLTLELSGVIDQQVVRVDLSLEADGDDSQTHEGSVYVGALEGDATGDGLVDAGDLNAVALKWQMPATSPQDADFTGDAFVDAGDLNVVALNWQAALARTSTAMATGQ